MLDIDRYQWPAALRKAIKGNRREAHSRYFQLATIGTDGTPKNRTVVFRGFGESGDSPLAITDTRSRKIVELERTSTTELCWYFPVTREQFRIAGIVQLYDASKDPKDLRQHLWDKLSDAAKTQFYWPAPGTADTDRETEVSELSSSEARTISGSPPTSFAVMSIEPEQVDHLLLHNPQRRIMSHLSQGPSGTLWQAHNVNP